MKTNWGSGYALRGQFQIFFYEIWVELVSLVKSPHREETFSCQLMDARRAVTSTSWLYAGCFGSLVANVWVFLNESSGVTWGVVTVRVDPINIILPI